MTNNGAFCLFVKEFHGTDRGFAEFDESKFAPLEWGHGVYMFPQEWVKAQGEAGRTVGYGHGSGAMRNLLLQVETDKPFIIDATEFRKPKADWAALKPHGWTFEGAPGERWGLGATTRDQQTRIAKQFSKAVRDAGYDSIIVRKGGVDREIVGIKPGSVKSKFAGQEMFSIRAFHGTPHSFDRFDMGKIGTGEGAQTYGHGLYFAENKATAEFYRDALSPFMKDGEPIDGMMMGTFARAKIEGRLDEMADSLNAAPPVHHVPLRRRGVPHASII